MSVYIENDATRKACLKRKTASLTKKCQELAKLCDVRLFYVIYVVGEEEPMFWPTSREEVVSLMNEYLQLPEIEKNRKKVTQESYLKEKVSKLDEQAKKVCKKNREMEARHHMRQIHLGGKNLQEFSSVELANLEDFAQNKLAMLLSKKKKTATDHHAIATSSNNPTPSALDKGKNIVGYS